MLPRERIKKKERKWKQVEENTRACALRTRGIEVISDRRRLNREVSLGEAYEFLASLWRLFIGPFLLRDG